MTEVNTIKGFKGFKGFDKDLKCRDFQYKIGEKYIHKGDVKSCMSGFHFCENPFDVWNYYPPTSRFVSVTGSGVFDKSEDKICYSEIEIGDEINLIDFIGFGVTHILKNLKSENIQHAMNTENIQHATNTENIQHATNTENIQHATNTGDHSVAANTGYHSAATNTGDHSAATNTGDHSVATNTGNYSDAIVDGKESVAVVTGFMSKAKGKIGNWIVLTERYEVTYDIKSVKVFKIDGIKIKEDTFYTLINNEAIASEN